MLRKKINKNVFNIYSPWHITTKATYVKSTLYSFTFAYYHRDLECDNYTKIAIQVCTGMYSQHWETIKQQVNLSPASS